MRNPTRLLLLLAALLPASCTEYWARPGGTQAQFNANRAACDSQALAHYPVVMVPTVVGGGFFVPGSTVCHTHHGHSSCYTRPGYWEPPIVMPVDANQGARTQAARNCLKALGWFPTTSRSEAQAITNMHLPPPPPPPRVPAGK